MKIKQFSQQGKRSNNEDRFGVANGLITVCDGMGGHNYGERASAFVVQNMLSTFEQPQKLGKMEIQQRLNKVQTDLNLLLEKEPELEKMGTTFTGIFITPDVWYAAHIGDSRIYLFRPSEQKLWHTWDHSLVGELMRTHEITVEAGRFHPMSNRISKAIIAQKDSKIASASIVKIDQLKPGDILMLCSDGVVEAWGDWDLVQLFSDNNLSFEQKCEKMAQQCDEKSKDNNTAIIVEIDEKNAFSFGSNDELEWTSFETVKADYLEYMKEIGDENEEENDVESATNNSSASAVETDSASEEDTDTPKTEPTRNTPKRSCASCRLWTIIVTFLLTAIIAMLLVFKYVVKSNNSENMISPKNKTEIKEQEKKHSSEQKQDTKKRDTKKEVEGRQNTDQTHENKQE